jgi:hypothetical protein
MNHLIVTTQTTSNSSINDTVMYSMRVATPHIRRNKLSPVLKFNFNSNGVTP